VELLGRAGDPRGAAVGYVANVAEPRRRVESVVGIRLCVFSEASR
jgi:hypothetical protein